MIEMSTDARLYAYESLPFFNNEKMAFYPKNRKTLINTVHSLCSRLEVSPPDSFSNITRPQFIQEVKEKFLDGSVSLEGAVELVKHHTGEEKDDKEDCITYLAVWPELGKELKAVYGLRYNPPG
jgi:hypothetical protein